MKNTILILLAFLVISCGKRHTPAESLSEDTNTISYSESNNKWKLKDHFQKKETIMLEATRESVFNGIDKLVVSNDKIFILDFLGTRSLYVLHFCFGLVNSTRN